MSIHSVSITPELRSVLVSLDCWNIQTNAIGHLASLVIGNPHMPQLRHGSMSAVIVGKRYGAAARRLVDEFRVLAQQCAIIRAETGDSELCAIAFFHLRFGSIHPLVDGNGRVARLLLAEQVRRAFAVELATTLDFLHQEQSDYREAFMPPVPQNRFELMASLLARATGAQNNSHPALSFPIAPAYPDKRPLLDSMKHGAGARSSNSENHLFRKRAVNIELQQALKVTR
jgi:Fic/DOC family